MASATAMTVKANTLNMAILPWPEAPAHRTNMLDKTFCRSDRYHKIVDCGEASDSLKL